MFGRTSVKFQKKSVLRFFEVVERYLLEGTPVAKCLESIEQRSNQNGKRKRFLVAASICTGSTTSSDVARVSLHVNVSMCAIYDMIYRHIERYLDYNII